jgi:hypothetical protein
VDETARAPDEGPIYAFRPRLMGAVFAFRLGAEGLEFEMGSRSGRIAYPMIARIRLGFRPTTFMGRRYTAEIFPRVGGKFEIASASARSVFDNTDQGAAFRSFIAELHRRIQHARSDCRFEAGMAAWRWWPSLVVTIGMVIGVLIIAGRAALDGQYGVGLVVVAVGLLFLWQMGAVLLHNRPRTYAPDAIPEDVLPRG